MGDAVLRVRRAAVRCVVVASLCVGAATLGGGRAWSAAGATCGTLAIQSGTAAGAAGGGSALTAVSFASPGNWWAVGDRYDAAAAAHQTLVERFDGSTWSVVPSPNATSMNNGMNAVSMTPTNGWAVGYAQQSGSSPTYQPLATRWDGAAWTIDSPAGFASDAVLTGVDAAADGSAWAVGFQIAPAGARRTLVEQTNGAAWTRVASPNDGTPNTRDNVLMSVSGTAQTGYWAVGYRQSPAGLKPLILRYDTRAATPGWVSVSASGAVPSPGKVETVLTAVDVRTATDVWAVGYYDHGSGERPLALHWDGTAWKNSWVAGVGMLRAVKLTTGGQGWAAGTYYDGSERRTKSLVVQLSGGSWTTAASADAAPPVADELMGLAARSDGAVVIAVGSEAAAPLAQRAGCPTGAVTLATRWAPVPPPAPVPPAIGPTPTPPAPSPPSRTVPPVTITDGATAARIADTGPSWSAAIGDFNNDGLPDIFVGHHGGPGRLWINRDTSPGIFDEADAGFFSGLDRHDCQAADFNRDGRQDMFCSVGADRGTGLKANALYIQQPDGGFQDQATSWNVTDPEGRGRYSAVLDANNDGFPDLFSGSASLRPDGLPSQNRLFLNTGRGSMVDSPAMGLDLNVGSGCAHTVDFNSDGWPDLLVCGRSDTTALSLHLYQNRQGTGFADVATTLGIGAPAEDAEMVDINHDGMPDLITLTLTTLTARLQRPDGSFAPAQLLLTLRGGRSLAIADVNGDNNPDIYVVAGKAGDTTNQPDHLLLGDGHGGFTEQDIPPEDVGQGDRAYAVDVNGDGLDEILVLNGRDRYPGPTELLTASPAN